MTLCIIKTEVFQMEKNSMIEALVMISLLAENLAKQLIVEEELEKPPDQLPVVTINIICKKKEETKNGANL